MDETEIICKSIEVIGQEGFKRIDKLAGYMFPWAGNRKRAYDMYIKAIENDPMLSEYEKAVRIANSKKDFRLLKNQHNIIAVALSEAKPNTVFSDYSKVNIQWIDQFFSKARYISDEEAQKLWGKILAREFEEPGSISYQLIRILSELTPEMAEAFTKLCGMCITMIGERYNGTFGEPYKTLFFVENIGTSLKSYITVSDLESLEAIGLLASKPTVWAPYTAVKMKDDCKFVHICFDSNVISLKLIGYDIPVGCRRLTKCGEELMNIISAKARNNFFSEITQFYTNFIKDNKNPQFSICPMPLIRTETDEFNNVINLHFQNRN